MIVLLRGNHLGEHQDYDEVLEGESGKCSYAKKGKVHFVVEKHTLWSITASGGQCSFYLLKPAVQPFLGQIVLVILIQD
ncbi:MULTISPECIES: hypothetical protein [Symbiopectobacterium]|uniref:hypothetical protein n=1 Tax=Symbiopectobacterium TaxID=801 RepID=UPI00207A956D|nr:MULTISPECIES: hypothetical protein [Symbiopectobacterium]MBT9429820.1 hypothetical protein [Candidatus Symbiopectobacterium endolongispinus]